MGHDVLPVSVVIPAYERPAMVERAIRSVLAQQPQPQELLVIDDCSGDDTGARAQALGAQVIRHEHNRGEGGSRNTGLSSAANEWVALLDCDDEWLPHHLQTLWSARDGHLLIGTAALGCGERPEDHRVYGWSGRHPRVMRSPADVLIPENKLTPSSVMVRRDSVLAAGGFCRDMPRAADLDMWVRLLERGSGLAIPEVTALYHVHSGQVSSDSPRMWEAHREVINSYAGRPWRTASLVGQYEGALAWDAARAALAGGRPAFRTTMTLLGRLARPHRLSGVAQLLAGRLRSRRRASRLAPGGSPAVALLPGAPSAETWAPGAIDLRSRGLSHALLYLLRRPASYAVTQRRAEALLVQVLGVTPTSRPPHIGETSTEEPL